jgi:hypothetical protein
MGRARDAALFVASAVVLAARRRDSTPAPRCYGVASCRWDDSGVVSVGCVGRRPRRTTSCGVVDVDDATGALQGGGGALGALGTDAAGLRW